MKNGGKVIELRQRRRPRDVRKYGNRIIALFDHYSVERDDPITLLLALVDRHVPGFKVRGSVGPCQRWIPVKQTLLIRSVDRYRERHRTASVLTACHHIAAAVLFGETATSLRRRYYEAKREMETASTARALALLESRPLGPALVALLMKAVLRGRLLSGGPSRHGKGWHRALASHNCDHAV
jgi:hypothetical protein